MILFLSQVIVNSYEIIVDFYVWDVAGEDLMLGIGLSALPFAVYHRSRYSMGRKCVSIHCCLTETPQKMTGVMLRRKMCNIGVGQKLKLPLCALL